MMRPTLALLIGLAAGCGPAPDAATAPAGPGAGDDPVEPAPSLPAVWVGAGTPEKIYDPGATESPARYINDHTFIQGPDGTWHLFGITAVPGTSPFQEWHFAHATAPSLHGPWTTQPHALTRDASYFDEQFLWAPHVIEHEGTYYMFYAGGGWQSAFNLATSTDLFTWTRRPEGPVFRDGVVGRDPFVARVGDRWVIYYTSTVTGQGDSADVVAYRTSTDLIHWSDRALAFVDPAGATFGVTESPVVLERDGHWYLFIGPRGGYVGTDVFRSDDPFHFEMSGYAGHIPSHAAEVIRDGDEWWISAAGWFQRGVSLAPLHWRATPPLWQSPRNPAVARDAGGRLHAFTLAADGHGIRHRHQLTANGAWTDWERFGVAGAVPTVAAGADGRLEVFAVSPDGRQVLHRRQRDAGAWDDWRPFGGPAGASPTVARGADGRLEAFLVGPAGAYLSHRAQDGPGGAWGEWTPFGTAAGGPPVVVAGPDGRLEVFAMGPGGAYLAHRRQRPDGSWNDWDGGFGGPAAWLSAVARNADGRLDVFAVTPAGYAVFHRTQRNTAGDWAPWEGFYMEAADGLSVGLNQRGALEVFVLAPGSHSVLRRWQTTPGGAWSPFEPFAGPAACAPSLTNGADGRLEVFLVAPGGAEVEHRQQRAPDPGFHDPQPWSGPVGAPVCGPAT